MRNRDTAEEAPARAGATREQLPVPPAVWAAPRRDVRVAALAGVLAALAGGAVILASLREHLASDFPAHMDFTVRAIHGDPPPGNFLFYAANALFAGFRTDPRALKLSLVLVLTAAIGAKVWLGVRFVTAERRGAAAPGDDPGPLPVWAAGAVVLCAFAFSLPVGGHGYLGQIPPNVWHNSTAILAMPFALGLFWTTLEFLRTGATRWLWRSLPLVALNLAAKPSFVLCLAPAFGLLALLRFGVRPPLRRAVLLLAGIAGLLAVQSAYVYAADPATADGGSGIAIRPLYVWHAYSSSIPLSILASSVLPLAALALGGAVVRASLAVRYAAVALLFGVAEYALLSERGPRAFDGNFTWQAILAMWVLLVALASALVPWYERRPRGVRQLAIAAVLALHVAAGVLYIQHWFVTGNFV